MKKDKTIAFVIAAGLLVGGTFVGTKAWFTDSATASNDLIVTMGNLDVEAIINTESKDDDANWIIVNGKTEITGKVNGDSGNDFKNASPRDSFEKTITVKNNGSLKQQITMSDLKLKSGKVLPTGVSAELKVKGSSNTYTDFVTNDGSFELSPNGTKEFKIVVTFDGAGTGGEYVSPGTANDGTEANKGNSLNTQAIQKFTFSEYFDAISIEANQVNK